MNRLRWLALLMVVAILGITGFQLYWLRQNYEREKNTLSLKTEMAFQETIMQLQVSKLKLDGAVWNSTDSGSGKMKILMHNDNRKNMPVHFKQKEEIVSTINIIRNKLKDSLKVNPAGTKGMVTISMNQASVNMTGDSIRFDRHIQTSPGNGDRIFSLLYGVDSLQDTLRLSEIDSAYTKALKKEKLNVPFSITQADSLDVSEAPVFNEVTVGLAKPITYKLRLGNTFPFLLKQITQPILFSVLLLGITILSFVLLYRNLLKQQRLGALKNEFISNITHELKTPIATVGVAIEALRNFNAIHDPARTKEYLDISANELQRLNLLVDKVLKLSMFEKKEVELKVEPVNLREVAEEVVGSLKLQLEKNNAHVTITSEGDMTVPADRLHLLSVIFNLVDNAVKYSKQVASIKIELQEEEKTVVVKVSDNGIGIPAEYKDKVFDKFFRIPHGDTHNAKGYGLGLSYVAQVVQKHNGTIEVESQPGIGTAFIIKLPKRTA